jgi:hypothetical protein
MRDGSDCTDVSIVVAHPVSAKIESQNVVTTLSVFMPGNPASGMVQGSRRFVKSRECDCWGSAGGALVSRCAQGIARGGGLGAGDFGHGHDHGHDSEAGPGGLQASVGAR